MTRRDRAEPLPGLGVRAPTARVRRYVDRQLRAQRALEQLRPVDDGLIGLAMTLADVIDAETVDPKGSRYTVGHLVGRLFPVLMELRGERLDVPGSDVDYDAELAAIVAAVRDVTGSVTPDVRPGDVGPPDPSA